MPENIHTKFWDERRSTPTQSRHNSDSQIRKEGGKPTSSVKTSGIKRLRDGSPKPALGLKTTVGQQIPVVAGGPKKFQSKATDTSQNGVRRSQHERRFSQASRKELAQLESLRKKLPIWSKQADIRWALRQNDVLLLNGETGSGKSTQVPQFLHNEPWCQQWKVKARTKAGHMEEVNVGGIIAITQPRRVAAITLAHRVAREMGCSITKGPTAGKVGYSVRFENAIPQGMKIKFVTEGTLLQEMLHDPNLRKYSAVIVDEIHERSIDVDLISGFLRTLLHGDKAGRGGIPLKVVVMSATLDLGGIEAFFGRKGSLLGYKPGNSHGRILAPHLLEYEVDGNPDPDESRRTSNGSSNAWHGFSDSEEDGDTSKLPSKPSPGDPRLAAAPEPPRAPLLNAEDSSSDTDMSSRVDEASENGVTVVYVEGRQYQVEILYEVKPTPDYLQNMLQTILQLHVKEPLPGDILAFLTGQDEIEALQTELESYAEKLVKTVPRMKVMPLYGSLSAQAQQDAFEKVKEPFTRKVVLATNIAETSVTVSGVRFVVDCGKSKVKQYRPRLGLESLLAKPISRVSAIQRAGRAGREAKGKCFRIYTEEDYLKLEQDELPEILRSDVVEAVLKMKARGVKDVLSFPLMDSPNTVAMEKALLRLHMMGALDDEGSLTDTGMKMAHFPLSAAYGRVLTAAADNQPQRLLDIIDVVSCLTTDSAIFLQPKSEEEMEATDGFRRDIRHREGDIITLLSTMQQYAGEPTDRGAWCRKRMISVRAMKMAMQIRKQLRQICFDSKLLKESPSPDPQPVSPITPERAKVVLKTFLKAFGPNTAVLAPDGRYVTTQGKNQISIHPSSVLYGKQIEAIMFLEHVFTAKSYAKGVSAIEAGWIVEALGI